MIEEIIKRECPRYVQREMIYHNKLRTVIIDTHSSLSYPVVIEPEEGLLDKMNSEYEQHLRSVLE